MKTIKLDHDVAQSIINNNQRILWLVFDDQYIAVGDEIELIDKVDPDDNGTWKAIGRATIEQVTEKRIKYITPADNPGGGSPDIILEKLKAKYGPVINADMAIRIVHFSFYKDSKQTANDVTITTHYTEVKLYTDGGSRGNPGPSALGFVITDSSGATIEAGSQYLGITTNNQAEYQAVRGGLEAAARYTTGNVAVFLDSQLVANQMNGIFKIKNRELWPIHRLIKDFIRMHFKEVTFTYVPRALNKDADTMVNQALDAYQNNQQNVL